MSLSVVNCVSQSLFSMHFNNFHDMQRWIQDFQRDAKFKLGLNLLFNKIFHKNCLKMKKPWVGGGGASKTYLCRSDTVKLFKVNPYQLEKLLCICQCTFPQVRFREVINSVIPTYSTHESFSGLTDPCFLFCFYASVL